jgi:hypothetical protein
MSAFAHQRVFEEIEDFVYEDTGKGMTFMPLTPTMVSIL